MIVGTSTKGCLAGQSSNSLPSSFSAAERRLTRKERTVVAAFEQELVTPSLENIAPLYVLTPQKKASIKFKQITASVQEIDLI